MRRALAILLVSAPLVLLASSDPNPALGQDFGKLLENAGRDLLKQQLSPENIERTLAPHTSGARSTRSAPPTAGRWSPTASRPRGSPAPGRCR